MGEYIVHKAVNLDKVKAAKRQVLSQPGYLDNNYLGQRKYDGCSVVFKLTIAGEADQVLSRTGERVRSLEWLLPHLQRLAAKMVVEHGGLVLLAEAWHPTYNFSTISGKYRAFADWLDPEIVVFDAIPLDDFEDGYCPTPYKERMGWFFGLSENGIGPEAAAVRPAATHFVPNTSGNETWQDYCNELVARGGYDGLILRDPEGTWTRGSGTTGEIIKLKRVLSFDLRCIGVEEGKGRLKGTMGAIIVDFQGKPLRVGTGFTDEQRRAWWQNPTQFSKDIVEIEAMDYSSDGLLREPRFKGIRFDKLETD